MQPFDYSSITDKEFEELCRDLLNKALSIDLQSFKKGRDKGIDLIQSSEKNEYEIVGQVKQFINSKISDLYGSLKNVEKPKIEKINPKRFIICTALSLNLNEKNKIITLLSPYVQNTSDVIGKEDLDKYLLANNHILENYYKLWLTSTKTLSAVVNGVSRSKAKLTESKIKSDIKLYVKNQNYNKAIDILKNKKFLLITGLPGVGKSTLAYILTFELIAQGYNLVFSDDQDIKEAEKAFIDDPEYKQIFLLDDFLGANYNEIVNPKTPHSSIVSFVERVIATPNKYCILTTRTNILNKAKTLSDKLVRSSIEISKIELEIKDYSILDKGKILYNHLKHSALNKDLIKQIFRDKNYWKIIRHKNYSPRIVDDITSIRILSSIREEKEYLACVLDNLENPEGVWSHAFVNQIDDDDRFFVFTLFAFGKETNSKILESAFNKRVTYEIDNNGHTKRTNSFNISIKRLLDTFIISNRFDENVTFQFINPSINDFLINYLIRSSEERVKIIDSVIYFVQFERLIKLYQYYELQRSCEFAEEVNYLIDKILKLNTTINFDSYRFTSHPDNLKKVLLSDLLCGTTWWNRSMIEKIDDYVFSIIQEIDVAEVILWSSDVIIRLFSNVELFNKSYIYIKTNFYPFVALIVREINSIDEFNDVKRLFEYYEENWKEFLKRDRPTKEKVESVIQENVKEYFSDERYNVNTVEDFEELKRDTYRQWSVHVNDLDINIDFYAKDYYNEDDMFEILALNNDRDVKVDFERMQQKEESKNNEAQMISEVDTLFDQFIKLNDEK